jgi:hypothetical protein
MKEQNEIVMIFSPVNLENLVNPVGIFFLPGGA